MHMLPITLGKIAAVRRMVNIHGWIDVVPR
jgi:hypothetical protein